MKLHTTFLTSFILYFNVFNLIAQELNWAKSFQEQTAGWTGTYHEQYMNGFKYTSDGGILTYGSFEDDVDFDPGPSQNIVNAGTFANGYIVKLDSLGAFSWIHRISGNYGTDITDIDVDEFGNIYATGSCRGVTVFDYASSFYSGAGADWNLFLMKLDSSGNFIWAQEYGSNANDDYGHKITVDQGKVLVAGLINGSVNLDPNFSNYTINTPYQSNFILSMDTNTMYNWIDYVPANGYQGIVLEHDVEGNILFGFNTGNHTYLNKYDETGTLLMDVDWGNGNDLFFEEIAFDDDGGIYLAGRGYNEIYSNPIYDMDPGPGQKLFNGGIFYLRLDANGNFYLGNGIGGSMWNGFVLSSAYGIDVDYLKNVYISGSFKSNVDFNPSPNASAILNAGSFTMNGFVARYDSLGNYTWAYKIGQDELDYSKFVHVDDELNVTSCGTFNCTVDFDPSSANYYLTAYGCDDWMSDAYIQQVKQDSCDHLILVIDTAVGLECTNSGFISCHGLNSQAPYSYSWDGVPFTSNPDLTTSTSGNHTVLVMSANGCIESRVVQLNGPVTSGVDVWVNCIQGAFIPGVNSHLILTAGNEGCSVSSGAITFVIPDLMNFQYSTIPPDYVNGDTLVWNYSGFDYQTPHFATEIFYSTDTLANIGDSICFPLTVTPLIDVYEPNNIRDYCFPVQNSYDPNNKNVYPSGVCIPNYIDTNDRLTYTINFQNTGTSDAINIYLLDEIDSDLDLSTLHVVTSSHDVITEILPNNLVKFRLDDIYLADSASNVVESKGYVIFELEQNNGLPINTEITNSVDIFFDYNAPIHTNTVSNMVVHTIPVSEYETIQLIACDSVVHNNISYHSSGNYLLGLVNVYGCDSLIDLDLEIKYSTSSFWNQTACDIYEVAGQTLDSSGYYEFQIENAVGCDSLIQLNFIRLNSTDTVNYADCDSVNVNGILYESGWL